MILIGVFQLAKHEPGVIFFFGSQKVTSRTLSILNTKFQPFNTIWREAKRAKSLKNKKIYQKLRAVSRCNAAEKLKYKKITLILLIYVLNFNLLAKFGGDLYVLQI